MPTLFQINGAANWGSTGKIAEQIGIHAIHRGWNSYIAYSRYANPSQSQLIKIGNKLTTMMHVLYARIFDKAGLASTFATRKLIKQIKSIKPDVIQIHNIHGYVINYKTLFEYLNNTDIKVVWTFHDCWAITGHCAHFLQIKCEKWKSVCGSCPLKKEYPSSYIFDASSSNYRLKKQLFSSCKNLTIVACSNWIYEIVKESFLNEKRIKVIYNGIDTSTFRPSEKKDDGDRFKVVAVSSVWNKDKGIFDLMKLRTLLPEDIDITVVGLTKKQQKLMPNGIRCIRRTQNINELVEIYSSSDVFVNPTYADTFPTVNIEALSCGIPVITYNTGGSPESIDQQTGIVVNQGDIKAMASAVLSMREHPFSSFSCTKRAQMHFNNIDNYNKYVDLYEMLLIQHS